MTSRSGSGPTAIGGCLAAVFQTTIPIGRLDLTSWENKIEADQTEIADDDGRDSDKDDDDDEEVETIDDAAVGDEANRSGEGLTRHDAFSNGVLTIGCVGDWNLFLSLYDKGGITPLAFLMRRTLGHTKHFQTILLTPTVRLCDCPGLVFPYKIDKNLQKAYTVGINPATSQLGARLSPGPSKLLTLKPVDEDADPRNHKWTPLDVCECMSKLSPPQNFL
ncbi:hypothetical protein DPMN_156740 [Dreissena polymorpha]|uniref:Uncharacterized protein n=1 Tax=Dreissena polymorpha TaxID=45954 RepID=A0A9D4FW72_DREPO|nr:hypothetical protein DPMN_156740 [Dreissena polymorpha]